MLWHFIKLINNFFDHVRIDDFVQSFVSRYTDMMLFPWGTNVLSVSFTLTFSYENTQNVKIYAFKPKKSQKP